LPVAVVPYLYIFFAPVEFTFNVGLDAVFLYVNFTKIKAPVSKTKLDNVTSLAAVE
jgi:hypothetical protein